MDASAAARERRSPQQVTHLPPVWDLYFHIHLVVDTKGFIISSERHQQWDMLQLTAVG